MNDNSMELIFATNNVHKLEEINKLLSNKVLVHSLLEVGISEDIPETGKTLNENASQKSWYIFNRLHKNCFADDTGLEIEVLNNEPGVYSARYAGEDKNSLKNMQKVLNKMDGLKNRNARFRTVISLIFDGKEYQFEGKIEGKIIDTPIGDKGFGYDPIFMPEGYTRTFAELELDVKNSISHRGIAVRKLAEFIVGL